jgi:hypothetical protein
MPFTTILYARRDPSLSETVDVILEQQSGTLVTEDAAWNISLAGLLDSSLVGRSASRAAMVEPRGFEPLTFCLPDKCSTS